jgi:hypothetical protein
MFCARFDFGKYRGRLVEDVPTGYLQWCLAECSGLSPWLRAEIGAVLRRRHAGPGQGDRRAADAAPGPGPPANWSAVMARWYREMSMKYHPDRGGSTQEMQAINHAYDRLRQLAGLEGSS